MVTSFDEELVTFELHDAANTASSENASAAFSEQRVKGSRDPLSGPG